ncbi:hypothetical protein BGZ57DRAFT_956494 [Hyaloscypha finlandica]|nr:hypothetical protein BGZ57DRAFT_956494 [Hyaloscypha finlandica]
MFEYIRDPDIITRIDTVAAGIYQDLLLIDQNTQGGTGLAAHWNEFYPSYFGQVSQIASTYIVAEII